MEVQAWHGEAMSYQGRIKEISDEVSTNIESLFASKISQYAVELAVLLGNLSEDMALAQMNYAAKWEAIRATADTDGRAEKKAHATQEYYQYRLLELRYKSVVHLINALKKRLSVLELEERTGR